MTSDQYEWPRAGDQLVDEAKTAENPEAAYVCINDGEAAGPKEIERQAVYINGDTGEIPDGLGCGTGGDILAGA